METLYRRSPVWMQTALLNLYALGLQWHRYGPEQRRVLSQLTAHERWDAGRIRSFQDDRIASLIRHAYRNTQYYRDLMRRRGLVPHDVTTTEDLIKLPVLERSTVAEQPENLMARDRPGLTWVHGHTSGTTGSPLGVWYDRATCICNAAADRRRKQWADMRSDDWIGLFLGRVLVPLEQSQPPFWRTNRIQREVWFSAFHMMDSTLDQYVTEIQRRGLRFLEGYPSTLYILARFLLERGRSLPMKAVFTSSETLHQLQRSAIEKAFECSLFDFYAMAERVLFAAECEQHCGKHVFETYGYMEVVDASGQRVEDGELGYLVGTSLHNTAMPLIRYRMSDLSRVKRTACPCGRSLIRMQDVATKAEDIVVTPDGRWISPSVLTHPFKPLSNIVASQIIQVDYDLIRVLLVPSESGVSREELDGLKKGLLTRLGPAVRVEIEMVHDVPRSTSGKFRWVISMVEHTASVDWNSAVISTGSSPVLMAERSRL